MRNYYYRDLDKLSKFINADIVWKNTVGSMVDIQQQLQQLRRSCLSSTRLLIIYHNVLWEPILNLASNLSLRRITGTQNWLDDSDFHNLCTLAGWDVISTGRRMLFPINLPILSYVLNNLLAHLPLINNLCLTTWIVARPKPTPMHHLSTSIIIPARNEAGNIPNILKLIPKFGKWQEVIFVEGHSSDGTWEEIQKLKYSSASHLRIKMFRQKGIGKADAVKLGFSKARGDILIILDADLTVEPHELQKFYQAIASGLGEFANGSRLVYPMDKQAMQTLNKFGNKVFGLLFTWIFGQRFKDTLCGTKAILRKNYVRITRTNKFFSCLDPFGDFALIFGAVKLNLKVIEIPVKYKERSYGSTNIHRIKNALQLARMTWYAFTKFRAW